MPRDLVVDPARLEKPGELATVAVPLHQTRSDIALARRELGDVALVTYLEEMLFIREFELMLDAFKREGRYGALEHVYKGPAHLSVGQEAVAVGQAHALRAGDHIFGSHRSHGEILAKGLAAIAELDEATLEAEIARYPVVDLAATVDRHLPGSDPKERARHLLVYGLLAEIFGCSTGFNRGLGGSMHAFFTPFGVYPNNAIVGGSAPIAAGAALERMVAGRDGIVVANVGDGAASAGPVLESLNFAAMAQIRNFRSDAPEGLPVLFCFVNNFYAMGGQPLGETLSLDRLSRLGAGFRADALHAATIDGNDPLAVRAEVGRCRQVLLSGRGPALLDCETYRFSGHSASDPSTYRTREEIALWQAFDPISRYRARLEDAGVLAPGRAEELAGAARTLLEEVAAVAIDPVRSPRLDLAVHPELMDRYMYAEREGPAGEPVPLLEPLQENARVRQIARRSRAGIVGGERLSPLRAVQLRDALFEAIVDRISEDARLVIYGEENREYGGAFGVYRGLTELLPPARLFNAPISEATIVASAVGVALEGGRALIELMYADFIGRAGDELINQLAKWRAMSGGLVQMPVVVRVSVGANYGAQHAQDLSGMLAQVPGLRVVYPVTPFDAKGMLTTALAGDDPVVFFESQELYEQTEWFHETGVPETSYRVPFAKAAVVRTGRDATVLSIGAPLYRALQAAELLRGEGVEAGVVDARSLAPFDLIGVAGEASRTGHLVVVTDAPGQGSFAKAVACDVAVACGTALAAPPTVVASRDWIVPPANLVDTFRPTPERIAEAVRRQLGRS